MDSIHSWLDVDRVRHLAESLLSPSEEESQKDSSSAKNGYGSSFEGFEALDTEQESWPSDDDKGTSPEPELLSSQAPPRKGIPTKPKKLPPATPPWNKKEKAEEPSDASPPSEELTPGMFLAPEEPPPQEPAVVDPAPSVVTSPFRLADDVATEPEPIVSPFQIVDSPFSYVDEESQKTDTTPTEPTQEKLPLFSQKEDALEEAPVQGNNSFFSLAPSPSPHPPKTDSALPFRERMIAFGDWLVSHFNAQQYFVSNQDGQHIYLENLDNPKIPTIALSLAETSLQTQRKTGAPATTSLGVSIEEGQHLEALPVFTSYGIMVVGLVLSRSLGEEEVQQISTTLRDVATPAQIDN